MASEIKRRAEARVIVYHYQRSRRNSGKSKRRCVQNRAFCAVRPFYKHRDHQRQNDYKVYYKIWPACGNCGSLCIIEDRFKIQENDISNELSNEIVNDVDLKEIVDVDMPDYIQGYGVLGQIVIDEIDMENYILDSTDDYSLNLAVTKFYGPDLNKRGNFVITGHNARGLFNNLKKLEVGDTFYIIDKETEEKVTYRINEKKTISPTDLDCLNQDTNNKRVVTLITCNTRGIDKTYAKSRRGIEFAPQNTKSSKGNLFKK